MKTLRQNRLTNSIDHLTGIVESFLVGKTFCRAGSFLPTNLMGAIDLLGRGALKRAFSFVPLKEVCAEEATPVLHDATITHI